MSAENLQPEVYSPGLEHITAGETAISTLEFGLAYRGYTIEELGEKSTFEETAFLLLYGELPKSNELRAFHARLAECAQLPREILATLRSIPTTAPTMDVLRSGVSLLAHWDADRADSSPSANLRKAERLLAQLPVLLAARFRLAHGLEPVPAVAHLGFSENLLWMLKGEAPSPRAARALEMTLMMYAEHEFNASTFAARVITSTLSDLHSAITGAIGALKGPLHGGANERVMEVLAEVGAPENAAGWIRQALAQKRRIMGFGHRVYKSGDPRAVFLKPLCQQLATETGHEDLERTAEVIEQVVVSEKKLPPNLDWPSARIYYYLGLPIDLYTPLFVVSRVTGWSAHVMEQWANNRLIRPRSRYIGPGQRAYVALGDR